MTAVGISFKSSLDLRGQSIEAGSHISDASSYPDVRSCREANHGVKLSSTVRNVVASTTPSIRITVRPMRISITPLGAAGTEVAAEELTGLGTGSSAGCSTVTGNNTVASCCCCA